MVFVTMFDIIDCSSGAARRASRFSGALVNSTFKPAVGRVNRYRSRPNRLRLGINKSNIGKGGPCVCTWSNVVFVFRQTVAFGILRAKTTNVSKRRVYSQSCAVVIQHLEQGKKYLLSIY